MNKHLRSIRCHSLKFILTALVFPALLHSCQSKSDTFYMPAEWEPHEAVWLGWQPDSTLGFYPVVAKIHTYTAKASYDMPASRFYNAEAPHVGDTLLRVPASSYLNYLVTNGLVLMSSYVAEGSSKAKEDRVRSIFEEQFPGRKIVFINAMPQNWDGGGIHCTTQHQPKTK